MEMLMYVVLPILGVVIGATLQYLFTRVLEEQRHQRNLKTQSYVDFVRNFVGAHFAREKDKEQEFISSLSDATTRIGIYGAKEVIEAIANIKRVSANYKKGNVSESEFIHSFIGVIQAIRKDNLPKEKVSDKDISQLLFGKE